MEGLELGWVGSCCCIVKETGDSLVVFDAAAAAVAVVALYSAATVGYWEDEVIAHLMLWVSGDLGSWGTVGSAGLMVGEVGAKG